MEKPSKRCGLLLMLSSVYNPLGLRAPFMLVEKKPFRNSANRSCNWINQLMKGQQISDLSGKTVC